MTQTMRLNRWKVCFLVADEYDDGPDQVDGHQCDGDGSADGHQCAESVGVDSLISFVLPR